MIYKGVLGLIDRLRAYAERATDAAVKIRNAGLANTIEALVQKLNDRLDAQPEGLNALDEIDAIADRVDLSVREKCAAIIRMLRPWVRADRTGRLTGRV
jgi:hypothetical protein